MIEKIPKPLTANPHESTWDHHGSYQWTYFSDEVKQLIKFFLLNRLDGKNLDVGCGWYLSYPNSVAVDLSSVCLKHNPAKEKLQFDLDEIGCGKKLPYKDHSFDSATLISVWQYLKHPVAVAKELERVLRPGSELYIINGQSSGLAECIIGASTSDEIQKFFKNLGYDTLVENIPFIDGSVNDFMSVCVAMPSYDLFGSTPSHIIKKSTRERKNRNIIDKPFLFLDNYLNWELRNVSHKLEKLSTFPVTRNSVDYLARAEKFSQEYNLRTGNIPLLFMENAIKPELLMTLPGEEPRCGTMFILGEDLTASMRDNLVSDLFKKHKLGGFSRYCGYFKHSKIDELLKYCSNFKLKKDQEYDSGNESELRRFTDFISTLSMNSFTKDLQTKMYGLLKLNVPDLDDLIKRKKALGYWLAVHESKQHRVIDDLISVKEQIINDNASIIRSEKLNYGPFMSALCSYIVKK